MARRSRFRRATRWLERALLGAAMTAAAFVIERRLLKVIKKGSGSSPESTRASGRLSVSRAPLPDDGA